MATERGVRTVSQLVYPTALCCTLGYSAAIGGPRLASALKGPCPASGASIGGGSGLVASCRGGIERATPSERAGTTPMYAGSGGDSSGGCRETGTVVSLGTVCGDLRRARCESRDGVRVARRSLEPSSSSAPSESSRVRSAGVRGVVALATGTPWEVVADAAVDAGGGGVGSSASEGSGVGGGPAVL